MRRPPAKRGESEKQPTPARVIAHHAHQHHVDPARRPVQLELGARELNAGPKRDRQAQRQNHLLELADQIERAAVEHRRIRGAGRTPRAPTIRTRLCRRSRANSAHERGTTPRWWPAPASPCSGSRSAPSASRRLRARSAQAKRGIDPGAARPVCCTAARARSTCPRFHSAGIRKRCPPTAR